VDLTEGMVVWEHRRNADDLRRGGLVVDAQSTPGFLWILDDRHLDGWVVEKRRWGGLRAANLPTAVLRRVAVTDLDTRLTEPAQPTTVLRFAWAALTQAAAEGPVRGSDLVETYRDLVKLAEELDR
jgi:hypothetical protein